MKGDKQILKLRGTFEVHDKELHYVCDETQYKAQIRFIEPTQLAYDDGSIKLTLSRRKHTEATSSNTPQPTLLGNWTSTQLSKAGVSTTNTMTFRGDTFTWTARVGSIELINLSGKYTLAGEKLELKATAGVNFEASIQLLDNNHMRFQDNTHDLSFTRN